jgi:hypothetical protein
MRYPNIVVAARPRPRIIVGGFTRTKVTRLPYIGPDRAEDPFGQARVWLTDREAASLGIEICWTDWITGCYKRL